MRAIILLALSVCAFNASAHGGRTNSQGCHNQKSTGGYHCHGGGSSKPAPNRFKSTESFANCAEARAAGVTPISRGNPGYSRKLDRDNDGLACE